MQSNWWIDALMFAQWATLAGVVFSILKLSLIREWPSLLLVAIFTLATQLVLYVSRPHYFFFFCFYWTSSAILSLLQLWILFDVLRAIPGIPMLSRGYIYTVTAALTSISIFAGVIAVVRNNSTPLAVQDWALLTSQAVNFATVVLLLGIFAWLISIGFGWTRRPFTVTAGIAAKAMLAYIAAIFLHTSSRSLHLCGQGISNIANLTYPAVCCYAMWRNEATLTLHPRQSELIALIYRSLQRN